MFKKILLLVFCGAQLMAACGQNLSQERIDTALIQLSAARDDTNKVNLLRYISSAYYTINYDEGIKYGMRGLELAEKIKWKSGIAKMYNSLGLNYSAKSDYSKAIEYYIKALKLNEELGNKKAVAGNLGNLANLYDGRSDYPKAIEYYLQAIQMFEESGDKIGAERNLVNLGNAYAAQPDYAKAIEIYLKALKLDEALGNKYGMTNSYTGISLVYSAQSDFPKALEYAFKALKVMEETGDKVNIAESLTAVGVIYTNQHDYARALEYVFKALKTDEELGSKTDLSYNYGEIGYIYLTMVMDSIHKQPVKIFGGNKRAALQQAEIYLDSSITVHKELGDLDNLKTIYENLSETQALLKDYRGALETYKNYTLTKDSIFNTEKDKDLTQTAMNYEFGKKQLADSLNHVEENIANQAKLQRQKLFTYAGFAGLGLIGISLFFVFRNYRNQKKANLIISKEKDRSDNLLLNILPAEVAEELKETGSARAKSFDQVTVLFTDFKGFTLLSERLSPEQLVGEINYCFSGFDNIISKYGIEKIKTIGDSYMCAGGLPVKNTTHAMDVVKAALEIRDFMLAYKKEKEASGGIPFEIRIGVNTGALVAGIVGVKKFAYDIWGDAVNIASRMESSGEVGKVNISETTYELVKDKFKCEYRGEVEAKNKGKLKMYFVEL